MSAEVNLIGLNELVVFDRWTLERRARALAAPAYLGGQLSLCRILGRYKLYVDTRDVGFGAHVLLDGFWESWLTVFMARRLKPGMAAIDVGANHGYYTLLFADLVGAEGRVAAVEPNPEICRLLRRSVSVNGFSGRTRIIEQAAGGEDGARARLLLPANEPKNARVVDWSSPDEGATEDTVVVGAGRLASLLEDWPRVDFIKVDVEGAEEAVVNGLMPILQRDRPQMVLEFHPARCADPAGLMAALTEIYGPPRMIDFDSEAHLVDPAALMDTSRADDWLLYFDAPRGKAGVSEKVGA